jgi:hypothetical protein
MRGGLLAMAGGPIGAKSSFISQSIMLWYGARWQKQLIHSGAVLALFALLYTIVFFPRICDGSSNISGDVFAYYLPVFLAPRSLWTSLLHSGFPSFADPQFQLWYPLNRLFAMFPHTWEAFTISAYVLASSFTYGYMYCLTKSRLAGVTSGLIYGMSGFMMAYWGYSTILHTAAWIPLLIWALEQLRDRRSGLWWLSGVMALACMLLAGHPQIAVYGLALGVAYALVFGHTAPVGRWRYYRHCSLMLVCALGLTAVQLWPMLEFAQRSVRAQMTFADFTSYSLLLPQLIQLFFPYYSPPKTNWLLGIFDYVGMLVPMLAAFECLALPWRGHTRFWLVVLLISFILALGSETPLAQVMYHVPIYNTRANAPDRESGNGCVGGFCDRTLTEWSNDIATFIARCFGRFGDDCDEFCHGCRFGTAGKYLADAGVTNRAMDDRISVINLAATVTLTIPPTVLAADHRIDYCD